jgi:hypothetical protein
MSGLKDRARWECFFVKKTEDIQNAKRPRKVRPCKDGSHHPLSVEVV